MFIMNSSYVMLLTASFLFFCFVKVFSSDKGVCFRKLVILILILSGFAYWHFFESQDKYKVFHPTPTQIKLQVNNNNGVGSGSIIEDESAMYDLHEKWIVITSISSSASSQQIKKLDPIPGWKLVVVTDSRVQKSNNLSPDLIILDPATQLKLGYNVLKHLPLNSSPSRKAIGYLYAIHNGAKIIYDTDIDTYSSTRNNFDKHFVLDKPTTRGLLLTTHQNSNVVNVYNHFGIQGSIYPRGYPVQLIGQEYNNTYTVCPAISTPLIQHLVVGGVQADIDAYSHLIREEQAKNLVDLQLDPFAPPAILPANLFAPFNSHSTIFHYGAFWGLVLPASLPIRVSDVWRSYWGQKLLWMINGNLGFYSMRQDYSSLQDKPENGTYSSLQNVGEEVRIHAEALDLIQLLTAWDCSRQNFYGCMIQLSQDLAEEGFWSREDVELISAWIQDLEMVGYKEPKMDFPSSIHNKQTCLDEKGESIAVFYPIHVDTVKEREQSSKESLREFCNLRETTPLNPEDGQFTSITFPSTLLVVTFNEISRARNIWLLDIIYRPAYQNIVYCLPFTDPKVFKLFSSLPEFQGVGLSQFSVVRANTTSGGNFAYECTLRAMEMNYGVTQYFILQDDVLFNYWNNVGLNSDEMWIYRSVESVLNTQIPYDSPTWSRWGWWRSQFGLNVTKGALNVIYHSNSTNGENEAVQKYRENRAKFGYNETMTMYGETDSYHVPGGEKGEIFYAVGNILRKFEVYMEIAVHLIMSGISSPQNVVILGGISLWGGDRNTPLSKFNASSSVIHPVKLSQVIGNMSFRAEYCDKYVRNILANV